MKEILEMTVGYLFWIFTMATTIQMMKKPNVCVHTYVQRCAYIYMRPAHVCVRTNT